MGVMLLVRHGRTAANVEGVLAGRSPGVALDDVGRRTAEALGQRLSAIPVVRVVSSPLERTLETARLVFPGMEPESEDGLLECDYGDWQGAKLSELAQHELWPSVQQRPDEVTFPGGEAMAEMARRASVAVREWDARISAEHGESAVWAAVSHGDVIKAIVADAMGLPLRRFQSLQVEPASVSVVRYGEHGASVVKWNESGDSWVESLASVEAAPTLGGQSGKGQG